MGEGENALKLDFKIRVVIENKMLDSMSSSK
jgi:hypothetical protein